jgi:hypothetical protein
MPTSPSDRGEVLFKVIEVGGAALERNLGRHQEDYIRAKFQEAVYFLPHNINKFSSYLTGSTVHIRSKPGTMTTTPQTPRVIFLDLNRSRHCYFR